MRVREKRRLVEPARRLLRVVTIRSGCLACQEFLETKRHLYYCLSACKQIFRLSQGNLAALEEYVKGWSSEPATAGHPL